MADRVWQDLKTRLTPEIWTVICGSGDPYSFSLLFDDHDEAEDLIKSMFPGMMSGQDLSLLAATLIKWKEDHAIRFGTCQRQLLRRVVRPRLESKQTIPISNDVIDLQQGNIVLVRSVSKSTFRQAMRNPTNTKAELEKAAKDRWASHLMTFVHEAELPLVKLAEATAFPTQTMLKAVGSRRSKTLRNRVRCWSKVHSWLVATKGVSHPRDVSDMIAYMLHCEQEGFTKSFVNEVAAALAVVEDVGMVDQSERISQHRTWLQVCSHMQAESEVGRTEKVTAPPITVAMVISLELQVIDNTRPAYERALSWVILVCVWACMRLDDLDGLDPRKVVVSSQGLRASLSKTKTTGPGKRVLHVPIFIYRRSGFSGVDWLTTGWSLWDHYNTVFPRDYLLMKPAGRSLEEPSLRYMSPATMATYVRAIFRQLQVPNRDTGERRWRLLTNNDLISDDLMMMFSGHSMRHFLPTVSSAMGYTKEQRDFLGR